jgi:tetratricopeptide (TPR) repeat protein
MNLRFARNVSLLFMILAPALSAAALTDTMQKGKEYYFAGEFKKAISQFELTRRIHPADPEPYLWLGKAYTMEADVKPAAFATRTRLKARMYLTEAVELAPDCDECRRELFDLLITSDGSPSALKHATLILRKMSESDPEYGSMQFLLARAREQVYSRESVIAAMFSAPSQTVAGLTVHPASSRPRLRPTNIYRLSSSE